MAKESKSERFIRLAEARVNKIIKMIRLLGNCSSKSVYAFEEKHVNQIFEALFEELYKARRRYYLAMHKAKPFSLSDTLEKIETPTYPYADLALPDGSMLRATAIDDENFPAINIHRLSQGKDSEHICFVEYNPERSSCHKVCIGVYQSDKEDTVFYEQYVRDEEV